MAIRNRLHKYSLWWFGIYFMKYMIYLKVLILFSCQLYQINAILYTIVKIYFIYYNIIVKNVYVMIIKIVNMFIR